MIFNASITSGGPLVQALWEACQQCGLFILVVWALCRIGRRLPAGIRAGLLWIACLKALLVLVWTRPIEVPVLPAAHAPAAALEIAPYGPSPNLQPSTRPAPSGAEAPVRLNNAEQARPSGDASEIGAEALIAVWLSGVLYNTFKLGRKWYAARLLVRHSVPVSDVETLQALRELARRAGLGCPPRIRHSSALTGPIVVGLFRPEMLLPTDFQRSVTPSELRMALAHEVAHISRRDLLLGLIPAMARIVYWFNPLVHLAAVAWANTCETACDAAAIRLTAVTPTAYGRLLVKLAAIHAAPTGIHAIGAGADYRAMERRIKMLRLNRVVSRKHLAAAFVLLAVPGLASVAPWRAVAPAEGAGAEAPAGFSPGTANAALASSNRQTSGPAEGAQASGAAGEMGAAAWHANPGIGQEIPLQETLDKLGYTVNVPKQYGGYEVTRWGAHPFSTGDDTVSASVFTVDEGATFQIVSQQAYLAGDVKFGLLNSNRDRQVIHKPSGTGYGIWLGHHHSAPETTPASGDFGLYIDCGEAGKSFGSGYYSSFANENPNSCSHLMVLPARTGGAWVDEGNNEGHWEGGKESGDYLLCWEDAESLPDFQDVVILTHGVHPIK